MGIVERLIHRLRGHTQRAHPIGPGYDLTVGIMIQCTCGKIWVL